MDIRCWSEEVEAICRYSQRSGAAPDWLGFQARQDFFSFAESFASFALGMSNFKFFCAGRALQSFETLGPKLGSTWQPVDKLLCCKVESLQKQSKRMPNKSYGSAGDVLVCLEHRVKGPGIGM